jgi:hypothetical protein
MKRAAQIKKWTINLTDVEIGAFACWKSRRVDRGAPRLADFAFGMTGYHER